MQTFPVVELQITPALEGMLMLVPLPCESNVAVAVERLSHRLLRALGVWISTSCCLQRHRERRHIVSSM